MRNTLVGVIILIQMTGISYAASFAETNLNADGVYAPKGFDANDVAEIIVSGWLPNSCFSRPQAEAKLEGGQIKVSVTATKNTEAASCLQMAVPFLAVAPIGRLEAKNYKVVVNDSERQMTALLSVVQPSSADIDNFVYARVESVSRTSFPRVVSLKGTNPSDCLALASIQMISNGENTYSILPVMHQVKATCMRKPMPFEYQIRIPEIQGPGRVLLHVRSQDGHSINYLLDN